MAKIRDILVSSQNLRYRLLLIFFGLFLFVMFTSKLWMPTEASPGLTTAIDSSVSLGDRQFFLRSWTYSPSQARMEVEIDIVNQAFDGIDAYTYEAVTKEGNVLEAKAVASDASMAVIEIDDLPDTFTNVLLRIYVAGTTGEYARLYSSFTDVERVDSIEPLGLKDYYLRRNENRLTQYDASIKDLENANADLLSKIDNAQLTISELETRKSMQVPEDAAVTQKRIDEIQRNIATWQSTIAGNNKEIEKYNGLISQVEITISQLKGEENYG